MKDRFNVELKQGDICARAHKLGNSSCMVVVMILNPLCRQIIATDYANRVRRTPTTINDTDKLIKLRPEDIPAELYEEFNQIKETRILLGKLERLN